MKLLLHLSGESLDLSKAEVEALFGCKAWRRGKVAKLETNLSLDKVVQLCDKSAMIKRAYANDVKIWQVQQGRFKEREPQKKPKFHPTALKPKLARLLVNLSQATKSNRLLDPFCGTGSILIEAAFLGLKPVGVDISKKAVWYSKVNLRYYGLKAKLMQGDATKLNELFKAESIDAIVTDPPYGRASMSSNKNLAELYEGFFESAWKVLKPGKWLVMLAPHYLKFRIKKFKKFKEFSWYVHRSLTRRVLVLKK